jgi:hypothetical protein
VKSATELCPALCGLTLTRYAIKLPEGLGYRTGSRVLVLPQNPPEVALAVTQALGLDADRPFRIRAFHAKHELFIPDEVTPRQLFEHYVDLFTRPTRALARAFLACVSGEQRERMEALFDPTAGVRFEEYAVSHTVAEFMQTYGPWGSPGLDELLSRTPPMRPRAYTIASSPKKRHRYLEIIVEAREGGVCPAFLKRIGTGRIPLKVVDTPAAYPRDRGAPVVIVAVGVGISRVLICQFQKKSQTVQIEKTVGGFVAEKLLDAALWGFSEEPAALCRWWEDAFAKAVHAVWPVWMDDRSCVYLAGAVGDGGGTRLRELLVQMTIMEGGLRDEEAAAWTDKHTIVVERLDREAS